ncbi:MAG: hypothetical protein JF630_18005, partial [Geodermatophilales bacterium]|nr:hypothetical protein [Geodermatophilales bacterium]
APAGGAHKGRPLTDRVAWVALGLALLALAVVRGLRHLLPGGPPPGEEPAAWPVTPLVLGGLVALAGVFPVPLPALVVLLAGLGFAALSLHVRATAGERIPVALKGGAAVLLLLLAAWALQRVLGPRDLAAAIVVSAESSALRLGLAGAAFGLLVLAGRRRDRPATGPVSRWAWIAVTLLLAGAALCDQPFAAVPLLAAGGAAAGAWADLRRLQTGMSLVVLILLSAFAAAGAWETAYRLALRAYAGDELLVRLAPPTRADLASVAGELRGHFLKSDLQSLVPRAPANLERQDLAYALWKDSPLARHHSLSALVVETPGGPSSFSWPGFEVHDWRRLSEVDVGLLKGGPVAGSAEGIADPALYALYTPDGRAALSPWEEEPPLPASLERSRGWLSHTVVETPSGPARAWARVSRQGWEAV